jgi:hypothetical protein
MGEMRASTARIEAVIGGCGRDHLLSSRIGKNFFMKLRIGK